MIDEQVDVTGRAPEMLTLLNDQVGLYDRLRSLADKQRQLVSGEDTKLLLKLLVERRRLTSELEELNGRLAPFRRDWPAVRESLEPDQRGKADELIRAANERLRAILNSDEEDVRRLSLRKQRVGVELSRVAAAKKAVSAYGGSGERSAVRLDRMHEES